MSIAVIENRAERARGPRPPGTRGARPSSYGVPDGDFAGPPGKDGGDDRAPGHDERYTVDGRRWRAAGGDREEDRREPQHGVEVRRHGEHVARHAGGALDLKLLALTLPHSNERQRVALRSERLCAGLGRSSAAGAAPRGR